MTPRAHQGAGEERRRLDSGQRQLAHLQEKRPRQDFVVFLQQRWWKTWHSRSHEVTLEEGGQRTGSQLLRRTPM